MNPNFGSAFFNGLPFTSVGDLLIFIGLLVCIGAVGIFAVYSLIRDLFYD